MSTFAVGTTDYGDQIVSHTVAEDSTPHVPGDTSGGLGQVAVTVAPSSFDDGFNLSQPCTFTSSMFPGTWYGTTSTVAPTLKSNSTAYTADGILSKLNTIKSAPPIMGFPLKYAIQTYVALCDNTITVGTPAADEFPGVNTVVIIPGWEDNVWNKIKEMCAAYGFQINIVGNVLYMLRIDFNPIDLAEDDLYSVQWAPTTNSQARTVAFTEYVNTMVVSTNELYRSKDAWQVPAGQTIVQVLELTATPRDVQQPVATADIADFTGSRYIVYADSSEIEQSGAWNGSGGLMTFELAGDYADDDLVTDAIYGRDLTPYSLVVTITAPGDLGIGSTWSIGASTAGDSTAYTGFVVWGTGVSFIKNVITFNTGAQNTATDIGTTIDSPFYDLDRIYARAPWTIGMYGGATATLQFSTPRFSADGATNLGMGLIAGRLILWRGEIYRVQTATLRRAGVDITAVPYVTVGDVDAKFGTLNTYRQRTLAFRSIDQGIRPLTIGS